MVIDWGLAGAIGACLMITDSHVPGDDDRIGTPPWCAPETSAAAPADPRMDVWALGALLRFALTGAAPDQARFLAKRGLGAIVARCLHEDPTQRYANGAEVAADMRRWLRDGVAMAEERMWAIRATLAMRRAVQHHPLLATTLLITYVVTSTVAGVVWRERVLASHQALNLLAASTPDAAGLRQWRAELAPLPDTAAVLLARGRIDRALADDDLRQLTRRYAHRGPWPNEITELTAALVNAGCDPLVPTAAAALRQHPQRPLLLAVAVQLQRAVLVNRQDSPLVVALPQLIAAAAPDAAWRSIADLLTRPIIGPHELELCLCDESEAALHQEDTANVLLATYAPDARLAALAEQYLHSNPGAFWPRITAGRAALIAKRNDDVRTHALVALGADPLSMWPHILLAYAALADNDNLTLISESAAGLRSNPEYLELQALHAVAIARSGHLDEAQALIDGLKQTPHFLHHLQHRTGHPMERTVDALGAAGIRFTVADPLPSTSTPAPIGQTSRSQ